MNCSDEKEIKTIQNNVTSAEANMKKYDDDDAKAQEELDGVIGEIEKMTADSVDVDQAELLSARLNIRSDYEHDAAAAIQEHYGKNYDPQIMRESHEKVMNLLHEEKVSLRDQLHIGNDINQARKFFHHQEVKNNAETQRSVRIAGTRKNQTGD